ncbi:MAG: thioredoxin domain-containing protein [Solirubrobacterales bacterium]
MPNRLADELSPYLLQHRDNPVEWWPWGPEAMAEARERDVPILLSVGYAACHWCHVMERESFEDPETARYMNEHFVPIKVDREERPDVDALYIEFVQSVTGHAGWPLTVFLDPNGVPFHGGTYFPDEPRLGSPSFRMVMEAVVEAWNEKREEIDAQAEEVVRRLSAIALVDAPEDLPDPRILEAAAKGMLESLDPVEGGFGDAPKFPPASAIDFLLAHGHAEEVGMTLDRMAAGGLWDQVGGGFCRYAVDAAWQVPHFEKMLYDNALLARTYLHAWQVTGLERYRRIAVEALEWALAEMTNGEGGFHASLDADSEGVEGLFYTWTPDELTAVLGDKADRGLELFGMTEAGNFEGRNVLRIPSGTPPDRFEGDDAEIRSTLLEARTGRVRPPLDDKAVCSWNALMISALAEAGAVLDRPDLVEAAIRCATFIWEEMRDGQGRLLRVWRNGEAGGGAFLEDHAFLLEALLDLYQATFDPVWFERARGISEEMIEGFGDRVRGGFFTTREAPEDGLIARRKDVGDHPIPSGSASAALGLLRLWGLTGEGRLRDEAEKILRMLAPASTRRPDAFGHLLKALDFALGDQTELALVGPSGSPFPGSVQTLLAPIRRRYLPNTVLAAGPEGTTAPPLLADRPTVDGDPSAYLCRRFVCLEPVTSPEALGEELDRDQIA